MGNVRTLHTVLFRNNSIEIFYPPKVLEPNLMIECQIKVYSEAVRCICTFCNGEIICFCIVG